MANDDNKFIFCNYKFFKAEVKQYNKLLNMKKCKYNSLGDMKKYILNTLSTYSEEELDFLKEFVKAKITKMDKYSSVLLPIMVAIYISALSATSAFVKSDFLWGIQVLFGITFLLGAFDYITNVKYLNYYKMLLRLIEKIEKINGRTYNDKIAENYKLENGRDTQSTIPEDTNVPVLPNALTDVLANNCDEKAMSCKQVERHESTEKI